MKLKMPFSNVVVGTAVMMEVAGHTAMFVKIHEEHGYNAINMGSWYLTTVDNDKWVEPIGPMRGDTIIN